EIGVPRPAPLVGGATVQFLVPPEGVLGSVAGIDAARAVEGVLDVRIYREPGFRLRPLRTGSDRAGAVLAVGASRTQAVARARRAARLVRFDTVDEQALV